MPIVVYMFLFYWNYYSSTVITWFLLVFDGYGSVVFRVYFLEGDEIGFVFFLFDSFMVLLTEASFRIVN